jgi:spermidine/putrescine transport system ATP-binding protein
MSQETEVELQEVTHRFGEVVAVERVSLKIDRGEFLTLLGPSGCGKTTLLRIIAGFEIPDEGRVILDGTDVTRTPPYRRNVTTVFQQYALFPHMDVFDNVAFGLARRRVDRKEIRRRVTSALEMVMLKGLEARRPAELSGGQQQRVALARALVVEPRVLLLDEPLAALDLQLRKQMQLELKGLQRRVGISFVYVTHDQEEALTMSDRVAVMNAGHLEQVGTPIDIYERPLTEFVAGFIGASNILEGTIESANNGLPIVAVGEARIQIPHRKLEPGGRVRLMIRPEKIQLGDPNAEKGLRGKIVSAVYMGEATRWLVEIEGGPVLTVLGQNRDPLSSGEYRIGQRVSAAWDPASAVVLTD